MEIKIGIRHISREVTLETKESVETIRTKVADAITNGSLLEITDDKGATTLVPGEQIGYVELGSEEKRLLLRYAPMEKVSAPNSRGTPNNFYEARIHGFAV